MPLDVAAFRRKGVELSIQFWGHEIVVTYDPLTVGDPTKRDERASRYQELRADIMRRVRREDDAVPHEDPDVEIEREDERIGWAEVDRPVVEMACMMIRSWDITHNDEPVPISVESFQRHGFPSALARTIIREVNQDVEQLGNPTGSDSTANG